MSTTVVGTFERVEERIPGSAPQSVEEVLPIEAALRALDDRLRIRWNPEAVMVKRGHYDVLGRATPPTYDGRWEVILLDSWGKTANWRSYELVCRVTPPVEVLEGTHRVRALQADGPYTPVGWWLVEHLQSVDRANTEQARRMSEQLDKVYAAREQRLARAGDDGTQEAAEQMWHGATKEVGISEFYPVTKTLTDDVTPRITLDGTTTLETRTAV